MDDNEFNLDVSEGMLAELGITSMRAQDGEQALALLRDLAFDAVLMDVQMPVMDGLEATRQIRTDMSLKGLCVIAMTANALPEDRQRYLHAGMDDVLTKPVDPQQLLATLAHWLAGARPPTSEPNSRAANNPAASPSPTLALWDDTVLTRYVGSDTGIRRRLISKYLDSARTQLAELDAAIQAADWAAASAVAHKLKSSSRTTGALQLGEHCQALEYSGRAGDVDTCRADHAALLACARDSLLLVQRHLEGLPA